MHRVIAVGLIAVLGCQSSAPELPVRPAPIAAPAPAPAAEPVPIDEPAVGAVPIPGTYPEPDVPINHRDPTVNVTDLPKASARWRERATIKYTGRVAIALHIARHEFLDLTVVDTVTQTESGYPGSLEAFRLGGADTTEQPQSGNALPTLDGPLMFAVRLLPRTGAPESERRQVAVYKVKQTIYVAEKLVTDAQWTPRLRIDAPRASEIVPIHPGWH